MEWQIDFRQYDIDRMSEILRRPENRSADLRPAFLRVIEDFQAGERALFETQGRSEGLDWPPIRPDTIRRHPERLGPMEMTGALKRSLTRRGAKYSIRKIEADMLTVGTRDPVSNLHQHKRPGSRNPRRPVLFVSKERGSRWIDILADHIFALDDQGDGPPVLGGGGL